MVSKNIGDRSFVNNDAIFFFKQKTAYEMRISDWSSDVCSSDLSRDPTDGRVMSAECRLPAVVLRVAAAARPLSASTPDPRPAACSPTAPDTRVPGLLEAIDADHHHHHHHPSPRGSPSRRLWRRGCRSPSWPPSSSSFFPFP